MELAICDCLVTGWCACHCIRYAVSCVHWTAENMWALTCKDWVFTFKCNVYENQSEPCILLNIYFLIFFTARAIPEKGSRVISELCGARSAILCQPWRALSHALRRPSPLTYSSCVSSVISTYTFTLFVFQNVFVLNSMGLTCWSSSWSRGRAEALPVDIGLGLTRAGLLTGLAYFVLREVSGVNLCFLILLWLKENGLF